MRSQNISDTTIGKQLVAYLETIHPYHFWFEYQGKIVMVLSDDSHMTNTKQLISEEAFKNLVTGNGLYVGYSNHTDHLHKARKAFNSAVTAARFSRRWDTSFHITAYEECKLYDLLSNLAPTCQSYSDYLPEPVVKIRQYDKEHNSEYFKTLATLVDCQFSKTRAAAALFISKSSLTYRINQMQELFDLDMENMTQMLHIQVAVYMLRYALAD